MDILSKLVAVHVDVSSWSGGASLKREDINVDLPERGFSLGRKYLIAPERLTPFPSLRRKARQRCLKVGTRFLGGFAIPADPEVVSALTADLEEIRREFEAEKSALLGDLTRAIDDWCSEPEIRPYEHLIRAAIPPLASIERRIQFRYSMYEVGEAPAAPAAALQEEVAAMSSGLFAEIAEAAQTLYDSFLRRNHNTDKGDWSFSGRTWAAMDGLLKKMRGLEFLDNRLPPIVDEMQRVLSSLPKSAKLEGNEMRKLYSLLVCLSDEQRMLSLGEGLLALPDVERQEFQFRKPVATPEPEPVPEHESEVEPAPEPVPEALPAPAPESEVEPEVEPEVVKTPFNGRFTLTF